MFFFRKGSKTVSNMKVDLHSHLIPGVDDGSKSEESSLAMLKGLQEMGYEKVITTPHIYPEIYPNKERDLEKRYQKLCLAKEREGLEIKIELAAEYFVDEHFLDRVKKGHGFLTFGNNYILIETGFMTLPLFWDDVIFSLKSHGYQPVLAHPERYDYVQEDPGRIGKWKKQGIRFQVSIPSFIGAYGNRARRTAIDMVKEGSHDFLGSDLHSERQLEQLKTAHRSKYFIRSASSSILNNRL